MIPPIFYNLRSTIARLFGGYYLWWQLVAIALTAAIVLSDFDWKYFIFFRGTSVPRLLSPAILLGFLVPIILPIILWLIGWLQKNVRLLITAGAVGQAAMMGLVLSSVYKAFTGRVPPVLFRHVSVLVDISHQFQFGFLRGGVFWGWPSSHTTVAFAIALALYVLYPDKKIIRYVALLFAVYVGIGISMSIHWFSEFVAGAIIGSVVGWAVGKSFKSYRN